MRYYDRIKGRAPNGHSQGLSEGVVGRWMERKWAENLQDERRIRRDETGEAAVGKDAILSVKQYHTSCGAYVFDDTRANALAVVLGRMGLTGHRKHSHCVDRTSAKSSKKNISASHGFQWM